MNTPEHSSSSGCVVVVDDDDAVRHLLALAFQTAGFEVLEAGTELELQRLLARRHPDALLIDLQRSVADGLHLLDRMRSRKALREVPILFLAGSYDDRLREQALAAGADYFGVRPLGMIELQNQLVELVRAHPHRTEPTRTHHHTRVS